MPWPKGKPRDPETVRKVTNSLRNMSKEKHDQWIAKLRDGRKAGENNPRWKGTNAGYAAAHHWARRHYPKTGVCMMCKQEGITELSNISHTYQRDLNDWQELCKSCHAKFDERSLHRQRDSKGRFI